MKKDNLIYLEHILNACRQITVYTGNLSEEIFLQDDKTKDAVVRQFEIIGEAVKRLTEELKTKYPSVSWKNMAGMRDVLIHDYINVDYWIVWRTVKNDIPSILIQIEEILEKEK